MSLYELPNATSGMDAILVETITAVPSFTPLILAFVFFVVFLGGISRQKIRTGTSDYAMWSVVAALATFMIALIMTMVEGIIHLDVLVIVVSVTIMCGVWLFLDRRQSEV